MNKSIDAKKFYTGIADVTSEELPENAKGAVYRVLTYADDYESFVDKVRAVLYDSGDTLIFIEEPEPLSKFLKHNWVTEEHEICEMMVTADKNKGDVVCGEIEYYAFDDA